MQQKESQCSHELRKREQECAKLKDRLLRLLVDKQGTTTGAPSIEVVPGAGGVRGRKGRAGWGTDTSAQVRVLVLLAEIFLVTIHEF